MECVTQSPGKAFTLDPLLVKAEDIGGLNP